MSDVPNRNPVVEFQIEFSKGGMGRLQSMIWRNGRANHKVSFQSAASSDALLTDGLPEYVCALATLLAEKRNIKHPLQKRFGALCLGALLPVAVHEHGVVLRYGIIAGDLWDVFKPKKDHVFDRALEDVFLPLTNLSSYLRVLSDGKTDHSGQALGLTADRIDEFLLAYGNRLQGWTDPVRLTA